MRQVTEINFVAFHGRAAPPPAPPPKGTGMRMAVLRTAAAKGYRLWKPLFWKIDFRVGHFMPVTISRYALSVVQGVQDSTTCRNCWDCSGHSHRYCHQN